MIRKRQRVSDVDLASEMTGNVPSLQPKTIIGWREWVRFPDFAGVRVRAKTDTGARTSALHAANIRLVEKDGRPLVTFDMYPRARSTEQVVHCSAPLIARRRIRNSGGQETFRYIIETNIEIGGDIWPIEISLTQRDRLQLRMLLGRTAVGGRYLVDPVNCHLLGK